VIQRRPPAKRLFQGLVGLPSESEGPVASAPTVVAVEESIVSGWPEPKCEYHHAGEQWICVYCSHHASEDDMTAAGVPAARVCPTKTINKENVKALDKKHAERERRAAAARARRKTKADQLAAIKEALRTPPEIRIAAAKQKELEERLAAREKKLPSDKTGGYKEISGGGIAEEIMLVADAPQTGRVTPDGVGHRPGTSSDTDNGNGTADEEATRDPWTQGSEEIAVRNSKSQIIPGSVFEVKLNNKDERDTPAYHSIPHYFIEVLTLRYRVRCTKCGAVQDDEHTVAEDQFTCWQCHAHHDGYEPNYVCRLCGDISTGADGAAYHMTNAHGDEALPGHDSRFGNVLQRWVKGGKKPPNITRTVKRAEKKVTA
jgi:hypothetical protein